MTEHLSDETWRQLDPYAGRLFCRDLLRVWLVVLVAAALSVAGVATVRSGLLLPRLEAGHVVTYFSDPGRPVFGYGFEIVNSGQFPVEITGVGRGGPGLAPVSPPAEVADGEPGRGNELGRLAPGERMWLAVGYEVTDCAAVPAEPWPIPIQVARPWGTYTYWLQPPLQWPDEITGEFDDPEPSVQWQRNLADAVC